MLMGEVRAEQFMRVLSPEVRATLSEAQVSAIRAAAEKNAWDRHPLDVRLSLPTPFGRYYLVMIGGPERRSAARRSLDRKRFSLLRPANLVLTTLVALAVGWILLAV